MVTNKYIFFLLLGFAGKIARKIVEDKTDSLLWNRLYKTFENRIENENMVTFMEDPTMRVSIFLLIQQSHSFR